MTRRGKRREGGDEIEYLREKQLLRFDDLTVQINCVEAPHIISRV